MGDAEFTDYLNRKVNLRRVAYLGSGQLDIPEEKHLVYGGWVEGWNSGIWNGGLGLGGNLYVDRILCFLFSSSQPGFGDIITQMPVACSGLSMPGA